MHNLRDWTHDRYRKVDDEPYGGGPGMVLKPEPIFEAIEELAEDTTQVVMLCPQGEQHRQAGEGTGRARAFAAAVRQLRGL